MRGQCVVDCIQRSVLSSLRPSCPFLSAVAVSVLLALRLLLAAQESRFTTYAYVGGHTHSDNYTGGLCQGLNDWCRDGTTYELNNPIGESLTNLGPTVNGTKVILCQMNVRRRLVELMNARVENNKTVYRRSNDRL